MSSEEKTEFKFVTNKPVYTGGPIVEYAILIYRPDGYIIVPAWN